MSDGVLVIATVVVAFFLAWVFIRALVEIDQRMR